MGRVTGSFEEGPISSKEWIIYMLSGGKAGSPPPEGWAPPDPIELDWDSENWLRVAKQDQLNSWGENTSLLKGDKIREGVKRLFNRKRR